MNSSKMNSTAKEAMHRFKMETAREVGVNLKEGYNGDLTSRQAGSIGGQMVKKNCPARTMNFERCNRTVQGHRDTVKYIVGLTI